MESRVRLLWITQKWPLPVEDGARQATYHLVSALARQGVEIHLLAIVPPGEAVDEDEAKRAFGVSQMSVVRREPTRHLWSLLTRPWEPLTFAPYRSRRMALEIDAIHEKWGRDSVIMFDGLHGAGWYWKLPRGRRQSMRVAHRSHNVESNLWKLGAKQSRFPKSIFLSYQAWLVARFEKRVCAESVLVAAVSQNDEKGLKDLYGELATTVTPIGIPLSPPSETQFPENKNLLFVGRLDWPPNRDGLKWFLEKVWPMVSERSQELSLKIVGAGDGDWLKPYLHLPRLQFLGRVPELASHYRECMATIVPIFFGSGTRVKAIEASSFARACISTEIGVEGIGLDPEKSYFRAETADEWVRVLLSLSPHETRRRGASAFDRISDEFDPEKVASRFIAELKSAVRKTSVV